MKIKQQKGAAAIYFVFVAVGILGLGALGVEGSRYITEKAHLGDTMEATAIAVAESDDLRDDAHFDQQQAKKIASAWVDYLMPDNKKKEFVVSREKEVFEKEVSGQKVTRTIHRYKLASTTTHDSWMAMSGVPSFEKQQKIFNKATAARVRTDFEPVDVVFVSDFSGSMSKHNRVKNLKYAISEVTKVIYEGTQELKKKHPGEKINDSSFGFVPFSKRVVFKEGNDYLCSSMLLPPKLTRYSRPRFQQNFSALVSMGSKEREKWYKKDSVKYSSNEKYVMEKYISWARTGSRRIDSNYSRNNGFNSHISYYRTATELQLDPNNLKLMTPMKMGQRNMKTERYCTTDSSTPAHYVIDRVVMSKKEEMEAFNNKIKPMRVGGGTDMYQALLVAPSQFHGAINKNRFVFVLSDGNENNHSFEYLVNNGLCETIRDKMAVNANGEPIKFEMFVIGLKFNNDAQEYKDCFGKRIYTVNDLSRLKDVIMELLSSTTSYNVERNK